MVTVPITAIGILLSGELEFGILVGFRCGGDGEQNDRERGDGGEWGEVVFGRSLPMRLKKNAKRLITS